MLGWELRVVTVLQEPGGRAMPPCIPQGLESPQVSNELLTPDELAEFLLHYGALRWLIPEQPLYLSTSGRLPGGKTLEASLGVSIVLNV